MLLALALGLGLGLQRRTASNTTLPPTLPLALSPTSAPTEQSASDYILSLLPTTTQETIEMEGPKSPQAMMTLGWLAKDPNFLFTMLLLCGESSSNLPW